MSLPVITKPASLTLIPESSELLGRSNTIAHGFFTRKGGVSQGIYHSLNLGYGSSDEREAVDENRNRVAEWFGQPVSQLHTLHQIHSTNVVTVMNRTQTSHSEADAHVTKHPNLILGILTADCIPLLFHDPNAGVIGAAHAGWKGALYGIIESTMDAMIALGASKQHIRVASGPSIARDSYEVDAGFRAAFLKEAPIYVSFFSPSPARPDTHFLCDLKAFAGHKLQAYGIPPEHIDISQQDTYANEASYFSYRRTTHQQQADYGRQLSAIMLRS